MFDRVPNTPLDIDKIVKKIIDVSQHKKRTLTSST